MGICLTLPPSVLGLCAVEETQPDTQGNGQGSVAVGMAIVWECMLRLYLQAQLGHAQHNGLHYRYLSVMCHGPQNCSNSCVWVHVEVRH